MRTGLAALFAAALLLPPAAGAQQAASPEDAKAVREVIEAQLDAFRRDDAARAYSYAAPAIKAMYDTPAEFMEMVRSFYKVVFRPSSVAFETPVMTASGELVQPVRLTDDEGQAWLAYYPMVRSPDRRWLINGCRLSRLGGRRI